MGFDLIRIHVSVDLKWCIKYTLLPLHGGRGRGTEVPTEVWHMLFYSLRRGRRPSCGEVDNVSLESITGALKVNSREICLNSEKNS